MAAPPPRGTWTIHEPHIPLARSHGYTDAGQILRAAFAGDFTPFNIELRWIPNPNNGDPFQTPRQADAHTHLSHIAYEWVSLGVHSANMGFENGVPTYPTDVEGRLLGLRRGRLRTGSERYPCLACFQDERREALQLGVQQGGEKKTMGKDCDKALPMCGKCLWNDRACVYRVGSGQDSASPGMGSGMGLSYPNAGSAPSAAPAPTAGTYPATPANGASSYPGNGDLNAEIRSMLPQHLHEASRCTRNTDLSPFHPINMADAPLRAVPATRQASLNPSTRASSGPASPSDSQTFPAQERRYRSPYSQTPEPAISANVGGGRSGTPMSWTGRPGTPVYAPTSRSQTPSEQGPAINTMPAMSNGSTSAPPNITLTPVHPVHTPHSVASTARSRNGVVAIPRLGSSTVPLATRPQSPTGSGLSAYPASAASSRTPSPLFNSFSILSRDNQMSGVHPSQPPGHPMQYPRGLPHTVGQSLPASSNALPTPGPSQPLTRRQSLTDFATGGQVAGPRLGRVEGQATSPATSNAPRPDNGVGMGQSFAPGYAGLVASSQYAVLNSLHGAGSPMPSPNWYQSFANPQLSAPETNPGFTDASPATSDTPQLSQQRPSPTPQPNFNSDYYADDTPVLMDIDFPQPSQHTAHANLPARPTRVFKTNAVPFKTSKWNPNKLHLPKSLTSSTTRTNSPLVATLYDTLNKDEDMLLANAPCLSCGLVNIHTPDCYLGTLENVNLKQHSKLTEAQLHTIGNAADRAALGGRQCGDDVLLGHGSAELERFETKVDGIAKLLKSDKTAMRDPVLRGLVGLSTEQEKGNGNGGKGDDAALLLVWALSGVSIDESDEGYDSWFDEEEEGEPVEIDSWIKKGRGD